MHLWVHDPRGDVLAQADGPVAALPAEDGFVAALTDLLSPYLSDQQRLPVIVAWIMHPQMHMPIRDIDPDPRGACTAHARGPVKRGMVK